MLGTCPRSWLLVTGAEGDTDKDGSFVEEVLTIWDQLVGLGDEGTDWAELQLELLDLETFSLLIPRMVVCILSCTKLCCFLGLLGFPDFSSSSSEKKTKSSSGLEIEANLADKFLGTELGLELFARLTEGFPKLKIGDGVSEGVLEDKFIIGFQERGVEPLDPLALGERDP